MLCSRERATIFAPYCLMTIAPEFHSSSCSSNGPRSVTRSGFWASSYLMFVRYCRACFCVWPMIRTHFFEWDPTTDQIGSDRERIVDLPDPRNASVTRYFSFGSSEYAKRSSWNDANGNLK